MKKLQLFPLVVKDSKKMTHAVLSLLSNEGYTFYVKEYKTLFVEDIKGNSYVWNPEKEVIDEALNNPVIDGLNLIRYVRENCNKNKPLVLLTDDTSKRESIQAQLVEEVA